MAKARPHRSHPDRTPLAEWIVGGVGLLVALAMLGVLLGEAVTERGSPPILTVAAGPATRTPAGWLLEVEVRNGGDVTAANVEIEGELGRETAGATLGYVAARGSTRAALIFRADPRGGGLELRATGFESP